MVGNNPAKATPQLQSQERMSYAEISARFVGCALSYVVHIPHCEAGQMTNVERKASRGLGTSRDRVIEADEQGRKPL